jgi:hypothetical protein
MRNDEVKMARTLEAPARVTALLALASLGAQGCWCEPSCGAAPPRPPISAETTTICSTQFDGGLPDIDFHENVVQVLMGAIESVCSVPQDYDAGCSLTRCSCDPSTLDTACSPYQQGGWLLAPCAPAVQLQLDRIYDAGACGDAIWRLCAIGDGCEPVSPGGC